MICAAIARQMYNIPVPNNEVSFESNNAYIDC